jgi:hypothetical protein
MKQWGSIFLGLFLITAVILVVIYVFPPLPQSEDLSPAAVAPNTSPKEPAIHASIISDSPETDGDDKIQVDYYIIVGAYRNLTQAQQKAEKLINDFDTNIIVLPPTVDGYYRISYGKYSTLEEAKSIIKSIKTKINSDAWILSGKK